LTYAASKVCDVVGLREHSKKLEVLSARVSHGIKEELLDLVRVRGVGRVRARILYDHGIKTVEELASTDPSKIANLKSFGPKVASNVVEEARKLVGSRRELRE
jgi:helicase